MNHQDDIVNDRRRNGHPRCCTCCMWICVSICALILVLLVVGVLFMSVLNSCLPSVHISGLSFAKVKLEQQPSQSLVNARIYVTVKFENKNGRMKLSYHSLGASVATENVNFGTIGIRDFTQGRGDQKSMNVSAEVNRVRLSKEDAKEFENETKNSETTANVMIRGGVGFHTGFFNLNYVPVQMLCDRVKQAEVVVAKEASCDIRMFPLKN